MSTLQVGTIKSSNSSPPVFQNSSATEIGQLAFAWANIDPDGSASIADSFNISSVTEQNGDHYSIAFARAAANANYATSCDVQTETNHFTNAHTTSGFDFRTGGMLSTAHFSFIAFGD
tara:strand:- start:130 stop:483 length:354 start_codon:yes stop_codon:yes gene_type:complete